MACNRTRPALSIPRGDRPQFRSTLPQVIDDDDPFWRLSPTTNISRRHHTAAVHNVEAHPLYTYGLEYFATIRAAAHNPSPTLHL